MKEYIPFDLSYWLKLSKGLSLNKQEEKQPEITLDNFLEARQPSVSKLESLSATNDPENADILESIIEDKRRFLAGLIEQFHFFYQKRIQISIRLHHSIEYSIMYYKYLAYGLNLWPRGYNSAVEKRHIHLEKIRNILEQEKRREDTACWRDLLAVSRDLKTLLKEYMELLIRKRIIQ